MYTFNWLPYTVFDWKWNVLKWKFIALHILAIRGEGLSVVGFMLYFKTQPLPIHFVLQCSHSYNPLRGTVSNITLTKLSLRYLNILLTLLHLQVLIVIDLMIQNRKLMSIRHSSSFDNRFLFVFRFAWVAIRRPES